MDMHQYSHGSVSSGFETHWSICPSKCFIVQFDRRILSSDSEDLDLLPNLAKVHCLRSLFTVLVYPPVNTTLLSTMVQWAASSALACYLREGSFELELEFL
jgi:hypothetical protein